MSGQPGPFRWFWAATVRQPCPDCGAPTAVGFDRCDTPSPPERCVKCTAEVIANEIQFSRAELGYPVTEQGPCTVCHEPTRRYGPEGAPQCGTCEAAMRDLEAEPELDVAL
jgi:hypothetical protein